MNENLLSGAPTPSGIETPRPDFQDKRMPGITGYFGQVGKKILPKSRAAGSQSVSVPAPSVDCGTTNYPPNPAPSDGQPSRSASTGSLGSLVEVDRDQVSDTPPTSDDMSYSTPERVEKQHSADQSPTPISSDPYEVENNGRAAENGGPLADGGLASITQALRNFVRPTSTFSSKAQRHQSLPTSSVTRNSVAAAHFSNPTSSSQSPHDTSPSSPPVSEDLHPSASVKELNKLTLDAASESREKNTPPLTPRALSQDEKITGARSPQSSASAPASDDGATGQNVVPAKQGDSLPTGTPRGKLAVRIAEGRGLKPSVDPYCVCVFEWNEYISKGPRNDRMEMDVDTDEKKPTNLSLSSIPIRRTDSDMGRPMAVPMRSRQSSNNGLDEHQGMDKVTDPHWDHEATLYVICVYRLCAC